MQLSTRPLRGSMGRWPRVTARLCGGLLATTLAFTANVHARVTQFEVQSIQPYGQFDAGAYVRIEAVAWGDLAADEPIPGLAHAPRNLAGRVGYRAPLTILAPRDPLPTSSSAPGRGALLVEVPNRGRAIAHALYNSPRAPFLPTGSLAHGNGFLQHHGYTLVVPTWELGTGITLPTFVDDKGVRRQIEGAGIAALRDIADFLRHARVDADGAPNPLAGRIDRTLAVGYSQTARVIKTMLIEGLNQTSAADGGRRVFDGMHVHASASGLAHIFANMPGPESGTFFTPRFTHPEFRGVTEEPLTYAAIVERVTRRGQVPPRLVVTNAVTDYYSIRASLSRTGAAGTVDLPQPDTVRIYDIAGASHARSARQTCEFSPAQLDYSPVMRASLLILDAWVRGAAPPPAHALMPLEPRPGEPTLLQAPQHLPGAIVQAPRRDADGNALGGVRLPDMEVPLGSHGQQNLPLSSRPCNLEGAYLAFAATPAERKPGDTRRSVVERYPSSADYVQRIRAATDRLVAQRFLLPADAADIVRAAQAVPGW